MSIMGIGNIDTKKDIIVKQGPSIATLHGSLCKIRVLFQ